MRVYLSGGMEYANAEGVHWRKELQSWIEDNLNHTCFNPNVESDIFFEKHYPDVNFRQAKIDNVGLYTEIATKLVEIDSEEISKRTDYLICYWDDGAAKGAGTKGELTIAKFFNKPVYLVTDFKTYDIPGWILGCTTKMFSNFEDLKSFLKNNYSNH